MPGHKKQHRNIRDMNKEGNMATQRKQSNVLILDAEKEIGRKPKKQKH